ncbi:MAG: GerMN domain-containing protein [Treponemataceae bacterium]|nr:GerMN domain-containing protein [Treponemataceae bacterium]
MANKDNKKKSGVGLAVWVVAALILLIVFLVTRERMMTVLKETDFFNKVFGKEPTFITNFEPKEKPEPEAEAEITEEIILENIASSKKQSITVETVTKEDVKPVVEESKSQSPSKVEIEKIEDSKTSQLAQSSSKSESQQKIEVQPTNVAKMDQHLFFIVISGDGSVIRKEVTRQISKTNTPLTAAINALLSGPNFDELEEGYMSLIPEGTKLLGASVNNGVATINFSENFLFNKYGVEGIYGQLMQVVYTATSFSNIDSVQFLIEGAKQEYLGEGVYVGAPLPRSVFR